jgi:methionyl-tRNA formyltransferase
VVNPQQPAPDSLRVVYFGTPEFAVPTLQALLDSRHVVCGVVTQPDKPRGRGQKVTEGPVKALALASGIPLIQPAKLRTADAAAAIASWTPEIGVVAAYGKLIPPDILRVPRYGMINVHASLLPLYRGAAPVHRAIIDGMPVTGVTIMRVVDLLDAGEMFATVRRPIAPDETSDVVERDLARLGAPLLLEVLDQLIAGTATAEPQDDMLSTYATRLTKEEGVVDWSLPAVYLHNRVRGLYPWPHAYTFLQGHRIILLKSRVDEVESTAAPGTVEAVSREAIHVAAGFGSRLAITELQAEGKRGMAARDFVAGHPIAAGTRLGGG